MQLKIPFYHVFLCIVLAGLIHLIAVFALPYVAPKNAWARLAPLSPINSMVLLPPAGKGEQPMPFMAPDTRYAVCRFDLHQGAVRVRAGVPNDLWLIALYTPRGDNFYTVAGADMRQQRIDLVLAREDQTVAEAGVDAPEGADEVVVVQSPVEEGIVLIRAPLIGPSRAPEIEQALRASFCGPHKQAAAPTPTPEPANANAPESMPGKSPEPAQSPEPEAAPGESPEPGTGEPR